MWLFFKPVCTAALKRNEDFISKKGEGIFSRQLDVSTTQLDSKIKLRSNIFDSFLSPAIRHITY